MQNIKKILWSNFELTEKVFGPTRENQQKDIIKLENKCDNTKYSCHYGIEYHICIFITFTYAIIL